MALFAPKGLRMKEQLYRDQLMLMLAHIASAATELKEVKF